MNKEDPSIEWQFKRSSTEYQTYTKGMPCLQTNSSGKKANL